MGQEIVYCSLCGSRILEKDLISGRAFTLLDKVFCADCKNQAFSQMDGGNSGPGTQATAVVGSPARGAAKPAPAPAPRRTAPAPAPRRPAPQEEEAQDYEEEPQEDYQDEPAPRAARKAGNPNVLLIGSAVGLLFLIAILVFVLTSQEKQKDDNAKKKKASDDSGGPVVETADQKASKKMNVLEEFAGTNPEPAKMLEKLTEAEGSIKGTMSYDRFKTMQRRWEMKLQDIGATKQLEELLSQARKMIETDNKTYTKYDEVRNLLRKARELAIQKAPDRNADVAEMERQYIEPYEAKASKWSSDKADYLRTLEEEGNYKGAIAIINRFPEELRKSEVWKQLQKQRDLDEQKLAAKNAGTDLKDWKYYVRLKRSDMTQQGFESARENALKAANILPPKDRWSIDEKHVIVWEIFYDLGCLYGHASKVKEGDEKKQLVDEAFKWLERAAQNEVFSIKCCKDHEKGIEHWTKDDDLATIRSDPRYDAIIKKYAK